MKIKTLELMTEEQLKEMLHELQHETGRLIAVLKRKMGISEQEWIDATQQVEEQLRDMDPGDAATDEQVLEQVIDTREWKEDNDEDRLEGT